MTGISRKRKQARFAACLLLALVTLASSCTSDKGRPPDDAAARCAVRGKLLAITGVDPNPDHLVRIELCPFRVETLAAGGGFSTVSAAEEHAVVAGNPDPGGVDKAWRVSGGRLLPLPGIADADAFAPAVSATGVVAFIRGRQGEGEGHNVAMLDSVEDVTPETVYVIPSDSTSLFWSGDRLRLLEAPGAASPRPGTEVDAVIRTIWPPEAKGEARTLRVTWPAGVRAGPDGLLAIQRNISRESAEGAVVDPSGNSVPLPSGWYPLTFAGDARDVLVANHQTADVGLASPPDYTRVSVLGKSPAGRVWYADWID